ncbi:hypothetical protein C8R45DRAFT_1221447 [Mycena sanguinolenta]|nr:hypothetical protein C8R45DRAFT_1221447 [Mycena sanguinolenta]
MPLALKQEVDALIPPFRTGMVLHAGLAMSENDTTPPPPEPQPHSLSFPAHAASSFIESVRTRQFLPLPPPASSRPSLDPLLLLLRTHPSFLYLHPPPPGFSIHPIFQPLVGRRECRGEARSNMHVRAEVADPRGRGSTHGRRWRVACVDRHGALRNGGGGGRQGTIAQRLRCSVSAERGITLEERAKLRPAALEMEDVSAARVASDELGAAQRLRSRASERGRSKTGIPRGVTGGNRREHGGAEKKKFAAFGSATSHAVSGEAERTFVSFVADISARYVAHTTSGADDVSTAISWCSNPRVAHAVHIVTFCTLRLTSRVRVRLSWCSSPPTSTSPQAFLFVPSFTSARTAQSAHVAIMHAIRQGSRPKILQPILLLELNQSVKRWYLMYFQCIEKYVEVGHAKLHRNYLHPRNDLARTILMSCIPMTYLTRSAHCCRSIKPSLGHDLNRWPEAFNNYYDRLSWRIHSIRSCSFAPFAVYTKESHRARSIASIYFF